MKNLKDTKAFKDFQAEISNRPENEQNHLTDQFISETEEQERRAEYFERVWLSGTESYMMDMRTAKWMFVQKAKEYDDKFDVKINTEYYQELIDYLFDENHRGLYIYGNVGSGKSLGLLAASQVKPTPNQIDARFKTENEIIEDKADKELFASYRRNNLIIDDLGTNGKDWKVDVIRGLVEDRYLLFKRDKKKTYFTSNLTIESLEDKFGLRVKDRIIEMCSVIKVVRKSLRA